MKIAILSDLHLGRRNFRRTIGETNMNAIEYKTYEQWHSCIDKIINNKPDLFVISGDFFHIANPSTLAISNALKGLRKLDKAGVKSLVVAGNHDSNLTNQINNIHPFKNLLEFKNIEFVYNEISYNDEHEGHFIVNIPHINVSTEEESQNFENMLRSVVPMLKKNSKKKKILITHGVAYSWIQRFINKDKENMKIDSTTMVFPDDFLSRFDFVITGHIHKSFVQAKTGVNDKSCKIIVPGSIMEDNPLEISIEENDIQSTGPLYLETEGGILKREYIESVRLIKRIVSSKEELYDLMSDIGFHIYSIKYEGPWSDVDLSLYNNAIKNSLNFNLQIKSEQKQTQYSSIQDFWNWVGKLHPEYLNEFTKITKEEN